MSKKKTPNYDFIVMFEEAQDKLKRQFAAMNTMREHGKLILTSSSIVVSLFAFFKISSIQIKDGFLLPYILLVGVIAFFYFMLMYYSINATLPNKLEHGVFPDRDYYMELFLDETDRKILNNRLSLYLTAIKNNEARIEKQYKISISLNNYMILLVASILFMAFLMPFMQA